MENGFMIIDIHTHIFPDEIAPRAMASLIEDAHTRPFCDGTASGLCKSRREAGIDWCVALPVATSPRQVIHMNDRAILTNDIRRETGLISFGGIHPDFEDWKRELERLARAGIKGIKLHPVFQKVNLDDLRYLRIMERAAELGLAILTHAGVYVDRPDSAFCTPRMALQVFKELGKVPMILAHMGGWRQWDEAEEIIPQIPFYLDTAYCLGPIVPFDQGSWQGGPLNTMSRDQFLRFIKLAGANRILFGTDSPWRDQKESVESILNLPITEGEKRAIFGENAAKLLGLKDYHAK